MSHDIYINRLHFLSRVDWYITWRILTIDDVINVKKLKTPFSTFMTSSMVEMSHAIYQSTRLKKCSRLIYITTHYDHRWRHKCKKTRFYYQGVSPRWIYPFKLIINGNFKKTFLRAICINEGSSSWLFLSSFICAVAWAAFSGANKSAIICRRPSIFQVETDRTSNTNYAWFVTGSTPLFDHNGFCHFWESITVNCREGRVSAIDFWKFGVFEKQLFS